MLGRIFAALRPPAKRDAVAVLHTRTGAHRLGVRLADGFVSRFRGLMLTPPLQSDRGLLLMQCASVHCAFMRYPIDVIYLDSSGTVLSCVRSLKPWRASIGMACGPQGRTRHTLELAAGSIDRLAIEWGDHLEHTHWSKSVRRQSLEGAARKDRGSAMTEFVVVGPVISLLGLAMLQYGLLFFAKNQINHASFMAARAGSVGNANLDSVQRAYASALIPLYGGGETAAEMAESLAKANADLAGHVRIELLNPTKESFEDWNAPARQTALGTGSKKVIPNSHQSFKDQQVGSASGQTIQDANLIKLRVTQGYMPKVPIVASIYRVYLKWLDPKSDSFHSELVADGRIPIVTSVVLQMQSDAIEGDPVSVPGPGNAGSPIDSGDPPIIDTVPPDCTTISCWSPHPPVENPPADPGGPCTGTVCPPCSNAT